MIHLRASFVVIVLLLACVLPRSAGAQALDHSASPLYGMRSAAPNFMPDPIEVPVVSGGPVNVASLGLGQGCVGFASRAPDFRFILQGRPTQLLRFFVEAAGADPTLVVNDPQGRWHCNDDVTRGNRNPLLDFANAQPGQYDVWVGSFSENESAQTTLKISEMRTQMPAENSVAGSPVANDAAGNAVRTSSGDGTGSGEGGGLGGLATRGGIGAAAQASDGTEIVEVRQRGKPPASASESAPPPATTLDRRVNIALREVRIPDRKPNGDPWDVGGGPDIAVRMSWARQTTGLRTGPRDQNPVNFNNTPAVLRDVRMTREQPVQVEIVDIDVAFHDPVAQGRLNFFNLSSCRQATPNAYECVLSLDGTSLTFDVSLLE